MLKPLIFILDIDGTMIGDISPQVMINDLINDMKFDKCKIQMDKMAVDYHYFFYHPNQLGK